MSILDRIRTTTVADLENVRSNFDDVAPVTYRAREPKNMVRIVEGADDLKPTIPNLGGNGLVGPGTPNTQPFVDEPMRDRQAGLIGVLTSKQLRPINPAAADAADVWFDRNRDTLTKVQASDWINRLRAKIAEGPVSGPVAAIPKTNVWADWRNLAERLAAIGGRFGTRFAIDTNDGAINKIAFWWIAPGRDGKYFLRQIIGGQGAVRVRMSPDAMLAIANKIVVAGPEEAMIRYGRELGECGHCGRELTNDDSRANGIGPVCIKKKGAWH